MKQPAQLLGAKNVVDLEIWPGDSDLPGKDVIISDSHVVLVLIRPETKRPINSQGNRLSLVKRSTTKRFENSSFLIVSQATYKLGAKTTCNFI